MDIQFYEAAEAELDDAIAYYEHQLPGLGVRYRLAIQAVLQRIAQFPEAYPLLSRRTRRCLVNGFPYGVIYRINEGTISIVAIAHLHRRPGYWVSRS
ncbi:type II toxin-antitoxin system RelE/ParE family toxin [Salinisphaera sp. Q1T1-3]|uniref:type II toxin-antitoxin system RelE/ParE family toxin n=1 Tax=Salinisphaera sp. Q1T1-3 TaxID=2321229 RepID=UPI000E7692D8|nr:type II toxin-antitoxin system RelE/ParE family toxin [Salinisphaera sp. Q1T1-3]RJS92578.1 type II toxin-antitoxin system RelE/ParE family toxin [Salinisphaera sp. Q1T1-3]